jgi:type IV pilus assembly protein PilX
MTRHLIMPTTPLQPAAQRGIVLIMALIMLVVISLLTAISVRNATSSEGVNANVRQTQLAGQAAETALRYCEQGVIDVLSASTSTFVFSVSVPPSSATVTLSGTHFQSFVTGTPTSMVPANWDSNAGTYPILVLPTASVNRAGITSTFSRPPECMIERLSPSTSAKASKNFTITARGFGPEVAAADASRTRPIGAEVWMQSTLELN